MQKKAHVIDDMIHCYGDPAQAKLAVEASTFSAAYSDALYEIASVCAWQGEAV